MPPAGFEPTIPVSERPQTHVLDGAATGIGLSNLLLGNNVFFVGLCNSVLVYTFVGKSHLFSIFCSLARSRGTSVFKMTG
jgi:hypothetical protein